MHIYRSIDTLTYQCGVPSDGAVKGGDRPSVRVIAVRHGRALHNETGGIWSGVNRDAMLVPGVGDIQAEATGTMNQSTCLC